MVFHARYKSSYGSLTGFFGGPHPHIAFTYPFIIPLSTSTMRWSLFSLVAILAVLIADVTALPTPQDGSSDLVLERRARFRMSVPKSKSSSSSSSSNSLKASTFKSSSSTYRNAALRGSNLRFPVKSGKITKSRAGTSKMPKGMDAGPCLCISIKGLDFIFLQTIFSRHKR